MGCRVHWDERSTLDLFGFAVDPEDPIISWRQPRVDVRSNDFGWAAHATR